MPEDERIEHLMNNPPKVELSRRDRFERAVMRVCGVIAVISFVVAGAGLVVKASAACVNTNLGTRNAPSAKDAQAHIDNSQAQLVYEMVDKRWHAALHKTLLAPKAEQAALYAKFLTVDSQLADAADAKVRADVAYQAQLATDQATRTAHPLGRC